MLCRQLTLACTHMHQQRWSSWGWSCLGHRPGSCPWSRQQSTRPRHKGHSWVRLQGCQAPSNSMPAVAGGQHGARQVCSMHGLQQPLNTIQPTCSRLAHAVIKASGTVGCILVGSAVDCVATAATCATGANLTARQHTHSHNFWQQSTRMLAQAVPAL